MARTLLAPTSTPTPYALAGIEVAALTALDNTNGNKFAYTGREILVVLNGGGASRTVTVKSVADDKGRVGDQVKAIADGHYAIFGPFPKAAGWLQTDGQVYVDISGTGVTGILLRHP